MDEFDAVITKHPSKFATTVSGSAILEREPSALQSELGTLEKAATNGHQECKWKKDFGEDQDRL